MEFSYSLDSKENIPLNNCIHYGPICVYGRRNKAPTLLTGRRSRFENLHGEELLQREKRRRKNRLLSKKLKQKRDNIEKQLIQQIKQLQTKQSRLISSIQQFQSYKKYLFNKLEDLIDPLFNLIYHNEIPLFFQQYDHSSFDIISVINTFQDEQSTFDDLLTISS